MTTTVTVLQELLRDAGYREGPDSCFVAPQRVVALRGVEGEPSTWPAAVDVALRLQPVAHAAAWSRYVVLVADAPPTPQLSAAAAAFGRNVEGCRRIVLVGDAAEGRATLPFLPAPGIEPAGLGPDGDPENAVRGTLLSSETIRLFLDPQAPATAVIAAIEENEE